MNKVILLALNILFWWMQRAGYGQIMDDFETGDLSPWTQSPENRWNADNVSPVSGAFSMHHSFDNPEAGFDLAGLSLMNLRPGQGTTTWSFRLRYGTDPSSTNNWTVYLMSDIGAGSIQNVEKPSGFAVGVNQDGSDDTLRIWRVEQGRFITVVKSRINWQTDIGTEEPANIKIMRTAAGDWTLTVYDSNGNPLGISSDHDPSLTNAGWFIVSYRYTSSRDRLLWFDDLEITGFFGDGPDPPETSEVFPGDVVFSEIMARPQPAVSLPGKEYLEIFNASKSDIPLGSWHLATQSQEYPFPGVTLRAGQYMILCQASDTALFRSWGAVAGFGSFPALTDGGRVLALLDGHGKLIDGIEYSSDWYNDDLKAEGGWSLEIINNGLPFSGGENWKASKTAEGGTPGRVSSVRGYNPDFSFRGIENVFPEDSVTVTLRLSETVTGLPARQDEVNIGNPSINGIQVVDRLFREFEITTTGAFNTGKIYQVCLGTGVKDFSGNPADRDCFGFGMPVPPARGDLRFNELLFNPLPGEPDFIELANCSGKIIDAAGLRLASVNQETGDTSATVALSAEHRCILPGALYAITTDRKSVISRFFSGDGDWIFQIPSLPSMPDDNGHLILLGRKLDVIDEIVYSEKLQFPLLKDNEGISLEKVRPESSSECGEYWHSASESCGWGTPGAVNSVYSEKPVENDAVVFSSAFITPDNDGNQDFLVLDIKLIGNGNVVLVWIFDETGSIVKKLTDNLFAGSEASVVWDGTADDGSLVETGIYVLLIKVFDDTGKTRHWKKVCTVIRN